MRKTPKSAEAIGDGTLLGAALDSMPYGFSIWDHARKLVLFNQHYLDMYNFTAETVQPGMSLRDICALTLSVGNQTGITTDELHQLYEQRLTESEQSAAPLKSQKPIRGRIINTTHVHRPGLGWIITHEDDTETVEQQWMAELREKRLADQNVRFEAALAHMTHGLAMYDSEHRLVICNQRYREIYDMPEALCRTGTAFQDVMAHRRASGAVPIEGAKDFVQHVLDEAGENRTLVQAYRMPDGRVISVVQSPMPNGAFITTHQDVTADVERVATLEANEQRMKLQNLRFEAAINNMNQGLCMFDKDSRLVICNEPYARMYNLPSELMQPGTSLTQILDFRFAHGMVPKDGRDSYIRNRKRLVDDQIVAKDEIEMEDGRTIEVNHHPMTDGGWVSTHEDVTEQRRVEARVRHLARHDALTDLPNRVLLREEMDKLEAFIERGETVAVLCLDLDHFKAVNDTLGHGIGDQVLVTVAERLKLCTRDTDIVARLGGDEFAILVHTLEGPPDAAAVASRIVESMAEPMEIEGHHIAIGTSIGIAVAPSDGADADTLLKNADLALYRAKGEGRGNYHFFEKGMDEALQQRRQLEQGLKFALARGEFRLMYQPLLSLANNRICCLEALIRWDHPERGVIGPSEFIPIAEETGVISAIGEWVLQQACLAAAEWPDDIRVAVNLSAAQFKNRLLVDHVSNALAAAGISARRLDLEVTESLLLGDTEQTLETLHRLRALGVRISMDDFGTGYSSLSYLRAFPFDKIKIDRSFMNGIGPHDDSAAIVKAVIGLGQSLGMSTTAEGIETEEQLAAVRAQGCNEVQGFLFSPPLPVSSIAALLRRESPVIAAKPQRRAS